MCKKFRSKKLLKFSIEFFHKFSMCPKGWFSKIGSHFMCSGNFRREEKWGRWWRKKKEEKSYQEILVIWPSWRYTSGTWAHGWLKMMKMMITLTAVVIKADFQRWSRCDMMWTIAEVSHPSYFVDGEINGLYALMMTSE